MTPGETAQLLSLIKRFDNRLVDDGTVVAWHQLMSDVEHADCVSAVLEHFRTSTTYLMPVHVLSGALRAANARAGRQAVTALEYRRALEDSAAGQRGPTEDRSQDVKQLLEQLASKLGPGRPEKLRRWERGERDV